MPGRRRALPAWMHDEEARAKEKEPPDGSRRRKGARSAFYCMNEKELVDAAVSYLASEDAALLADHKVEDKAGDTTVKFREKPASSKRKARPVTEALEEESSDCCDAQETTYVSETDLDITEEETVQYTDQKQHHFPEGQGSGPVEMEAEKREERSQTPADAVEEEEEDALRVVREIFFTR